MADSRNGGPARRGGGESALLGVIGFRPGFVAVLVFLTLTVGLVAFRITWDAAPKRAEALVRETLRIYPGRIPEGSAARSEEPEGIETRIREWTGLKLSLPRDEHLFTFHGVSRERMGRQPAAAVRLSYEGEEFLLVALRAEDARKGGGTFGFFSGHSFLSGEEEGKSFVCWERGGGRFFLVSEADLTRTFALVRRHFASAGGGAIP